MSIGTSLGNYYDDEHHMAAVKSNKFNTLDQNIIHPDNPFIDSTQDQNVFTGEGIIHDDTPIPVNMQDDSNKFYELSDDQFIKNIDKNPGLFAPENMQDKYKK